MTAEEKLKELYEDWSYQLTPEQIKQGWKSIVPTGVSPQDIDLIANLVVERLKESDGVL